MKKQSRFYIQISSPIVIGLLLASSPATFLDFGPAVIQQPQKQSKTKPVYFSGSQFFVKANFREAKF